MTPFFRATVLLAVAGAGLSSGVIARADDAPEPKERRAFDAATGRNLLNYPPHRSADVRHMRLQLRIPNMNERTMLATETLTIAPIARPVSVLALNAALLQIGSVSTPGHACTFEKNPDEETVAITLDPPLSVGQTADVTISYRVSDPPDGLSWYIESPTHPGRAAQVYSQGESESNRYWFVGHDSPNARMTCELSVTVPRGYQVVSNGRLSSMVEEKLEPFDTFTWTQDKPIPMYLVDLAVGKWNVVDVGTLSLPMPVYVAPGQGDRVRATFSRTPRMVEMLSRLSGEPYPWAKYAQVSVNAFAWGGMENASATTLYETVALDKTALLDGDQDELIVHELAHQWFGDLLTCKSWEHIWLNEGFATYAESLWQQYKDSSVPGSPAAIAAARGNDDAYLATIWAWQRDVIGNDTGAAPYQPAMASKEYDAPDDVFDRAANPYPKGALLLHMLRERLGDAVFFKGLQDYVKKYKLQSVETFQFRECMERASGTSLQRFFDQWAFRPLTPHIRVTHAWDASAGQLTVNFEQQQTIDGYNPAFDLRVPVWVRIKGQASWSKLDAAFDTRTHTLTVPLAGEPEMVVVDPELSTLAEFEVEGTSLDWAQQLVSGPTMGARLRAAKALGRPGEGDVATRALSNVVREDRVHRSLRMEAVRSLGAIGSPASGVLRGLMDASLADAQVRAVVLEQVAHATMESDAQAKAALATRLTQIFAKEPSYGVRAAAIRALGALKSEAGWGAIVAALSTDSQHDQIRKAALGALADSDRADALPLVMARLTPDNSSDVRPEACAALGRLAHHDPERAFRLLAALIDDREPKTVQAAGKALASIGGQRVRDLFEQRLNVLTSRYLKGKTRDWLREIKTEDSSATTP